MSDSVKYISNKQYHKSNYDEALKYLIPEIYFEEDAQNNPKEIDILDQVINSNLRIIGNISDILYITPIAGTSFSGLDTASGISKYFVKQNNLTDIDANDFERKILIPLNTDLKDFRTSAEFSDYLKDYLLPNIRLNNPTLNFDGNDPADNHKYLINNLSWLYFLNLDDATLDYNPSSYVHDLLVDKIYVSNKVTLNDGIKGLITYIWKNYSDFPLWNSLKLIPASFTPSMATDEFTDGEQQLSKLLTLIDIIYSPLYIDSGDLRVKTAIDDYLQNGYLIEKKISTGPFIKLVKAISYSFADYSNSVDLLETLNDINYCPDELLPYLADLIGWRLLGSEPDRWRLQIVNAVKIYKSMGTKKAIQFAADSVFGQDVFDVSTNISEMWESYIPNLIYYALATESKLFESYDTWTFDKANTIGIGPYNTSSFDVNIRQAVDYVVLQLVSSFPDTFYFNGEKFPLNSTDFIFNYRGRDYPIPPFEEYKYYLNIKVNYDLVDSLIDKLICLSVSQDFAIKVGNYIKQQLLNIDREDVRLSSGFLFFTSSIEYPPNFDDVISDIDNYNPEYLALWNGKSSNFLLTFETSSFDFAKDSLEADSREALKIASEVVKEFSPAHAIPNILASARVTDDYEATNTEFNYINVDKVEQAGISFSSCYLSNRGTSGIAMNFYKRGINSAGATFSREQADGIFDFAVSSQSAYIVPRKAHRRRNFKFILPKDGFYDRTGFNMPLSFQSYITSSNYYPLGFIPSSLTYQGISNYNNIPPVYDKCETFQSINSYYGVAVSSTYPIRGWKPSINN